MSELYKIQLGIDLDTSDLQTQINGAGSNVKPIPIKIEIENLDKVKKQIQNLGNIKGNKGLLSINAESVEASLRDVATAIKDIRASIGTLDDGSGMKSLLSSINQISSALDKASNQFAELNASLDSLAKKDFSINFGINMGKNPIAQQAAYGSLARSSIIPQLKQQVDSLVRYYNSANKTSANEMQALTNLVSGTKLANPAFFNDLFDKKGGLATRMGDGSNLKQQIAALKEFITMFQKAAALKGLDLTPVTSEFSQTADQLATQAEKARTGVTQLDDSFEKLKGVFSGSIDSDSLSGVLEPVMQDLKAIREAIESLSKNSSLDGLTASFNKLSEILEQLMTNAKLFQDTLGSGNIGTNLSGHTKEAEKTAKAYREATDEARKLGSISIDVADGDIDNIRDALRNLKVDDSDIEETTRKLNEMNVVAKNVSGTFKDGKLVKLDIKGVQTTADGLSRVVTITENLGKDGWSSTVKYSQALDELANKAEKVNKKLKGSSSGTSKFDDEILAAETSYSKLTKTTKELDVAMEALRSSFGEVKAASAAGDAERLVAANERYEDSLRSVNSLLKQNEAAEKARNNEKDFEVAKERALLKLRGLFEDNSEAARKFGSEAERLQRELDECGDVKGLQQVEKKINNLSTKIKRAGAQTQTFGQRLKDQWERYKSYLSVASVFMYGEQALRSMFEQVKLIDSAMTELKKVTDETDATYNKFLTNAASKAKEIGTTVDGLVSSTADFARLGYDFVDAQGLAEVANIYAVVGDDIDSVEAATQSLISTLTAFKDEAGDLSNSDFALSIVDKMNEVANNFAISSGGLGEALQRSASSMMAANNSLDETIALITAANTVVNLCHAA